MPPLQTGQTDQKIDFQRQKTTGNDFPTTENDRKRFSNDKKQPETTENDRKRQKNDKKGRIFLRGLPFPQRNFPILAKPCLRKRRAMMMSLMLLRS
jgi:hypothetical protein